MTMTDEAKDRHAPEAKVPIDTSRLIASRFEGHWTRGYTRGKLRSDPVYAATAHIVADHPAPLLDVGCGPGLLAHYLHANDCAIPYLGIDSDARKIALADKAARGLENVSFQQCLCPELPTWRGHVVLLDVVHYLGAQEQACLLRKAAARLLPGASLVIRTVLRDASWRFRMTRMEETFIRYSGWIRGGVKHYPSLTELCAILRRDGLAPQVRPLYGRTPFNSHLIHARRPMA